MTPDPNPYPPATTEIGSDEYVLVGLPGTGLRVRVSAWPPLDVPVMVTVSAEHVRDGTPAPFSVEADGA